jgi:hypothetical protein
MKGLTWYYITRLALVALWLLVAAVAGLPVWLDLPVAAAMMTYFVWLPRSGRYVVREDEPLAPFGRDERSQALSSRAAAWAFAVETSLVCAGAVWGVVSQQQVFAGFLGLVLAASLMTYLVAQGWLARTS